LNLGGDSSILEKEVKTTIVDYGVKYVDYNRGRIGKQDNRNESLSVCLSVCLSIYLSIYLSTYLFTHARTHTHTYIVYNVILFLISMQ